MKDPTSSRPKVYLPNLSSHDISDAHRFGDIIPLTEGKISRYSTNHLYREIEPIIAESSPEDYILLTGLTVINVIVASLYALKHNRLNLLIHRADDNTYINRIINF